MSGVFGVLEGEGGSEELRECFILSVVLGSGAQKSTRTKIFQVPFINLARVHVYFFTFPKDSSSPCFEGHVGVASEVEDERLMTGWTQPSCDPVWRLYSTSLPKIISIILRPFIDLYLGLLHRSQLSTLPNTSSSNGGVLPCNVSSNLNFPRESTHSP